MNRILHLLSASALICMLWPAPARGQDDVITIGGARTRGAFLIVVQRMAPRGDLVAGTITVNGAEIGGTYENAKVLIPAGEYKGVLRASSESSHEQGPFGMLAKKGDFLLEVAGVQGRTDILFHGGDKPEHSKGCILLGGVTRDPLTRGGVVPDTSPLRRLRTLFYGTDVPNATPDVDISIVIRDWRSRPE
jgi:hypothetical protein